MSITFITDVRQGETDILSKVKCKPLIVKDLSGLHLKTIEAPAGGWTHELLCQTNDSLTGDTVLGAEAFLGIRWVGSTEV